MRIIVADNAGFCFGVKRAVNMANEELSNSKEKIYSLGPLIHNPQAVGKLEAQGLITINDLDEIKDDKVIIRSHGVGKDIINVIESKNGNIVDCTCPYVKSVHQKVEEFHEQGYNIIIIGDSDHPEVIGINGWCNHEAIVVNTEKQAINLPIMDKICIVSQTTNTKEKFESLSKLISQKGNDVHIYNTICNATNLRQRSCRELAGKVDLMIVIGGFHSSNTLKLAQISRQYCDNVYHIETVDELPLDKIAKFDTIGITAGASTPDWIIKEVVETMDNINNNEIVENTEDNETVEDIENIETVENADDIESVESSEDSEFVEDIEDSESVESAEESETVESTEDSESVDNEGETTDSIADNEMMEAIESSFTRIHRGDIIKGEVIFVTNNEIMVNINYKSDGIINKEELSNDPSVSPKDLYKPGDEIDVYVIRHDDGEGNVVLSVKRVANIKNLDELEEVFKNKEKIECKVVNNIKGGLAVLVNGVNGFMPASQVSVKYVDDLSVYKDKTLIAKIIDFDRDKRRIILSSKEVEREELDNKRKELWEVLEVGQLREGTVQRLTDFGAFVDLGGIDGLIHISDLAWNRIKHPSEAVKVGEKVEVKVLAFDQERNRISLGLKQTVEEPWNIFINNAKDGDIVEGTIVNLVDFGAFVRLKEGVDGLLHVSQISEEHIAKPSDVLEIGQVLNVKIIEINEEDRKISLSLKQAIEETAKVVEEVNDEDMEQGVTIGDIINEK